VFSTWEKIDVNLNSNKEKGEKGFVWDDGEAMSIEMSDGVGFSPTKAEHQFLWDRKHKI